MHQLNKSLVLIKVDQPAEQDASGVFIQEEWQQQPPTGVVEAVAPDVLFCKAGDKVFFERYSAIPTPYGKEYRLCREDSIFEVLDGEG